MRFYHWLYIALLLFIGVGRLVQKVSTDTGGFASRYAPLIIALVLISGLVGYLVKKPLLKRWCWGAVLWLSAAGSACLLLFGAYLLATIGGSAFFSASLIMAGLLVLIPAQYVLYKYVHCSQQIWSQSC